MTDTRTEARRRVRRGQGLVEFALILPILLLVLIGMLEFGRILFIYVNVSNAAREGVRYGVVHPSDQQGIRNQVWEYQALIPAVNAIVSYDHGPDTATFTNGDEAVPGTDRVGVLIGCLVEPLTPIMQPFMPDGLYLETESWRTIQYVGTGAISTPAGPAPPMYTSTPTATFTPTPTPTLTPTPEDTPTPTLTPTLTPTPTPTPIPIVINPVDFEDTTVLGTAAPERAVTLLVAQTGLQRTVTVQADGTFTFSGLHEMQCGYTIVVSGYGTQAYATVCEGATPTPTPTHTPTPTPTATPSGAFIYTAPGCLEPGTLAITVNGSQIDANSSYKDIVFRLDGVQVGGEHPYDFAAGAFAEEIVITVDYAEPRVHTIRAEIVNNQDTVLLSMETEITVCDPVLMPDLRITDLTVLDELPLSTYQLLHALITIRNDGERDVTSVFWVQLYGDYMIGVELDQQNVVQQTAFTSLAAGDNMSFTMVMREGFYTIGMHNLAAAVDVWSQIDESDEDNNIWASEIISVSVPGPTPEPTPVVTVGPSGTVMGSALVETVGLQDIYVRINTYPEQATYTDPSGGYVFGTVPIGTWVITADYFDVIDSVYYLGTRTVIVTEGDTSLADVFLSPFP